MTRATIRNPSSPQMEVFMGCDIAAAVGPGPSVAVSSGTIVMSVVVTTAAIGLSA